MSRRLISPLQFLSFSVVAFFSALTFSWVFEKGDPKFVYLQLNDHSRIPAALRESSNLEEGGLLKVLREKEFLTSVEIVNTPSVSAIKYEQFAVLDHNQMTLSCAKFNQVEFIFSADGQATAGESPQLSVVAPCAWSNDGLSQAKAVLIPSQEILSRQAQDGTIELSEFNQYRYRFSHIGSSWPKAWTLDEVRFTEPNGELKVFKTADLFSRTSLARAQIPTMVW